MSRPPLPGIYYYPLDVDFTNDRKFRRISRRFGLLAHAAVPALWRFIYKEKGYYMEWTQDACYDLSEEICCGESELQQLVEYCLEVELFHQTLYETYGILTSAGIQRRYEMVRKECKRRQRIDERYLLLTTEESVEKEDVKVKSRNRKEGKNKKTDSSGADNSYSLPEVLPGDTAGERPSAYREPDRGVFNHFQEITTPIREETPLKQEITPCERERMPQRKTEERKTNQSKTEENKSDPSPLSPPRREGKGETEKEGSFVSLPDGYPAEIPVYAWNTQTHNLTGLIERLRALRVTTDEELMAILRLSDYGRKHTPVWSIISVNNWPEAQNRSSSRFRQIARPGQYILKILSNERKRMS
ncbi:MAG: DUF4373 domain-containing protein [Bacteroides sp.]|nr:DUF4373 domain-containing protein [Bacteroides sp.]